MVNKPFIELAFVQGKYPLEVFVLEPLFEEIPEPKHFCTFLVNRSLAVLKLGVPECPPHGCVGVKFILDRQCFFDFEHSLPLFKCLLGSEIQQLFSFFALSNKFSQ